MSARLDSLLMNHPALWRADAHARVPQPAVPTGHARLDAWLPDGGWPVASLIEVLHARPGLGEVNLFRHLLQQLTRPEESFAPALCWVDPPHQPYAPALAAWGLDPGRQLIVRTPSPAQGLWAMEQALRSRACGVVMGWVDEAPLRWLRRLKLAAVQGGGVGILFRPLRHRARPSPATMRLALHEADRQAGWRLEILKIQGGKPGDLQWQ